MENHEARAAYQDGLQDGAMSALAPALGVQPQEGFTHTLMGRRLTVSIEWLDGPLDERELETARLMAQRALDRIAERSRDA
jgi:hypothetical protein